MVYTDKELTEWARSGGITPFNPDRINPASIDLCWSGKIREAIDHPDRWSEVYTGNHATLLKDNLYLLDTSETIRMPDNAVGFLMLKSSLGRQGLEHLHAGLFDPGFFGTGTLELENRHCHPITLSRGQPIIQLCLVKTSDLPHLTYHFTGRYNGQFEPQPSR